MTTNKTQFESTETFDDVTDEGTPPEESANTEEAEREKAFNEGLSKISGTEPPESVDKPAQLFAGMTEDELKAAVQKAAQIDELNERLKNTRDTAFGKMGQLEQTIRELAANASASRGAPVQLSKDTFKRLAEVFDDEGVAEALAEDLAGLQFEKPDLSEFSKTVAESLRESLLPELKQELSQDFEVKLLTFLHSDWQEIRDSEEFAHWRTTLKPEDQAVLDTSWDGATLAQAFTQFKTWRDKRAEAVEKRTRRLEDAAVPARRGGGPGQRTSGELSGFERGIQRVLANNR